MASRSAIDCYSAGVPDLLIQRRPPYVMLILKRRTGLAPAWPVFLWVSHATEDKNQVQTTTQASDFQVNLTPNLQHQTLVLLRQSPAETTRTGSA